MNAVKSDRLRSAWILGRVGLALAAAWTITPAIGGQHVAPPLWFLAPILWTALHLGGRTTIVVALLGGVLAGPLTPADMATGASQPLSVWVVRLFFFLLVAVVTARGGARLRDTALRDPLTGLGNRAAFEPSLLAALARGRRDGDAVGLVYLDLDDFKVVNDRLGHATGDELLCEVGARLEAAKRGGDMLARHGGDEFIVVLEGLGPAADQEAAGRRAMAAVERLVEAVRAPLQVGGVDLQVDCSAGLSLFPHDAGDVDDLHRHADAAMYVAKADRLSCALYAPSARDPLVRLSRAARLRSAVAAGDLELHYQPIFAVGGDLQGVEALVRWRDGDAGLVAPSDFIPLAEETGIIDALGDWVLNALCAQARLWADQGLWPHLGFNVAPRQLRQPRFAERVAEVLAVHRLEPRHFVVELTESAWTVEADLTMPALTALRAAGLSLAIDDFGAGYSSLSRLLELPVDVIKIDRTFLRGVPDDPQSVAVVTAVLELAAACGSDVVAEGVETEAQHAFLAQRGCALAQGYALARPAPADEVTRLLHERLDPARRDAVACQVTAAAA